MKSLIIKLGKIFSLFRRVGFKTAIEIIYGYIEKYVVSTFFPVSGNVFIVVNGVGDSAHYRAFNQAEELNLHKIKATVVNQNRLFLKSLAKNGQIFIFARTFSTPKLKEFFQELKKRKKVVFFETDDLVFDAKLHPDAFNTNFNNFGLMINGNQLNLGADFCSEYRHSAPLEVFTSTLDTNSFKQISIPLLDFKQRQMQVIDLVFAIKGVNAPANKNLLIINNVKWVTNLE